MAEEIELGDIAQDLITGFGGTVTGKCVYISGCDQILLAPQVSAEGELRESHWFDLDRCRVVTKKAIDPSQVSSSARPGHDKPAPKR